MYAAKNARVEILAEKRKEQWVALMLKNADLFSPYKKVIKLYIE